MEPIWNRAERAGRGPRPAHSRDEVAATAVRIADTEGIDAVSMRRVSAELGAGTASLYRYLTGKDELLDIMADTVLRAAKPPRHTGDWRADVRALARRSRTMLLRHPWLSTVMVTRPSLGPGMLRWLESWYSSVAGLGLDPDGILTFIDTVHLFMHGSVMREIAERNADFNQETWLAAQHSYGESIIASGAYPTLISIMVKAEAPHRKDRHERAFLAGLDRILAAPLPDAG